MGITFTLHLYCSAAFDISAAVMSEESLAEREAARQGHTGQDDTAVELGGDSKVGLESRCMQVIHVNRVQAACRLLVAHLAGLVIWSVLKGCRGLSTQVEYL